MFPDPGLRLLRRLRHRRAESAGVDHLHHAGRRLRHRRLDRRRALEVEIAPRQALGGSNFTLILYKIIKKFYIEFYIKSI